MSAPDSTRVPSAGDQIMALPANMVPAPDPSIMSAEFAQRFAVNVAGLSEAITQPFYSTVLYPAAGTAGQLNFFNNVPGNPAATTLEDTNMQAVGSFPAGSSFLLQGVGVDLLTGVAASRFGAQSANGALLDYATVMPRGYFLLTIGNKPYLQDSNMLSLPTRSHINGIAALSDQTTAAAAMQSAISIGFSDGPVFAPRPLLIPSLQNFAVSIAYPRGAVALPSANATTRMMVKFYGTLFRPVQ